MPFFDPEHAYFFHTPKYNLPFGRIWAHPSLPGSSGIGPLASVEENKFQAIDFQLRGAARAFGDGINYVSGVFIEGNYGQSIVDEEATVQLDSLGAVVNDIAIGNAPNEENGPPTWSGVDVTQDNYLFVKIIEASFISDFIDSRQNNRFETFIQDTVVNTDPNSLLLAVRTSGLKSPINEDVSNKVYLSLDRHIDAIDPHGSIWEQDQIVVSGISGLNVFDSGDIYGNAIVSGAVSISESGSIESLQGHAWPDGIFHNDLVVGNNPFLKDAVFRQVSGTVLQADAVVFETKSSEAHFNSGTLIGPNAAPVSSGTLANIHVFGSGVFHKEITFAGGQFAIDHDRPSVNGAILDQHLSDFEDPHNLTPVRLSGVGRMGVGDPKQWAVDPFEPRSDSIYWRLQGNWPVTSGISIDGIDPSVMGAMLDGTVVDSLAPGIPVVEPEFHHYRFEASSGAAFIDSIGNENLDELKDPLYGQSSVGGAYNFAAGLSSGVSFIRAEFPIPNFPQKPFTLAGWVKGSLTGDPLTDLFAHQTVTQDGWNLLNDGSFLSGVRADFVSPDGRSGVVHNNREGLINDDWNYVSLVYDGQDAFIGVNGKVTSGSVPSWAEVEPKNQPHRFSVLGNSRGFVSGASNFDFNDISSSDPFWLFNAGLGVFLLNVSHGLGTDELIHSVWSNHASGLELSDHRVDFTTTNALVYSDANTFDGSLVLSAVGGNAGIITDKFSGLDVSSGWENNDGVLTHIFNHNLGTIDLKVDVYEQGAGTVNSQSIEIISDNNSITLLAADHGDTFEGQMTVAGGLGGLGRFKSKTFSKSDWVGSGQKTFAFKHGFSTKHLIVNVLDRNGSVVALDTVQIISDGDNIILVVSDAASAFDGKVYVGDGSATLSSSWNNALVDEVSYHLGVAWPQYQKDYTNPSAPFSHPSHLANPNEYNHQHLMLPPEGQYVAIAPEYPGLVVSGLSPGTFETSRKLDHNWYDWYAYEEADVIIFTRIPVPTGSKKMVAMGMLARASDGGVGQSKFQVEVRDTNGDLVSGVPTHWIHPPVDSRYIVFSGGGVFDTLDGVFDSGDMFEIMVRMRSVSGLGIHLGPIGTRFIH